VGRVSSNFQLLTPNFWRSPWTEEAGGSEARDSEAGAAVISWQLADGGVS
jgi:hypothetical protein